MRASLNMKGYVSLIIVINVSRSVRSAENNTLCDRLSRGYPISASSGPLW